MGFARAGIAPAEPTQRRAELLAWLGAGKHGQMRWLEDDLEQRLDPASFVPGARSIVIVADQYASRADSPSASPSGPVDRSGKLARYARARDYHHVIKRRLHALADSLRPRYPGHEFRSFVDTAPILEREHAARAGLGWIGKHTLLIDPRLGSYLLLGGIVTTLELAPEPDRRPVADHCGACTRCIDACPTRAITPFSVDATRCISYLTIEHRSTIDPSLQSGMREWVFGCDVCQEVCPFNSPRPASAPVVDDRVNRAYSPRRLSLDLLEILAWDEPARRRAFATSPMKRATLEMMKRNALIALGNSLFSRPDGPDGAILARIRQIAVDPAEPGLVRDTARQVLSRVEAGGTDGPILF